MKTIAISCRKGGSAKTTSVWNIGASIALQQPDARVLLVDLDPQASLTIMTGFEPGDDQFRGNGARRIFTSNADITDNCFGVESMGTDIAERLYLIPADYALSTDEMNLARKTNGELILKQRLAALRNDFDVVILDCPPQIEMLTMSAWSAADEIIIPTRPDYISYRAWASTLSAAQQYMERKNPALHYRGTIVAMYEKVNREQRDTLTMLQKNTQVLGVVKKSADVTRDTYAGIPVVKAYPRSEPAEAYQMIAKEITKA